VFSLRGDQYKYITYYGLWDTDELYDIKADPDEAKNLIHDPKFKPIAATMEKRLYTMMAELGGMEVPLNAPSGGISNLRLRARGGEKAADFPAPMVVDKPVNADAK
jgi:N-acetylglucosamine-6-sulfatase